MPRPRKSIKGCDRFTFSAPKEFFEGEFAVLKQMAESEGRSVSELIVEAICEYVARHGGGSLELPLSILEQLELDSAIEALWMKLMNAPKSDEDIKKRGRSWLDDFNKRTLPLIRRVFYIGSRNEEFVKLVQQLSAIRRRVSRKLLGIEDEGAGIETSIARQVSGSTPRLIEIAGEVIAEEIQSPEPGTSEMIKKPLISLDDAVNFFAHARLYPEKYCGKCEFCDRDDDGVVGVLEVPTSEGRFEYFVCERCFDEFVRKYKVEHQRKPYIIRLRYTGE